MKVKSIESKKLFGVGFYNDENGNHKIDSSLSSYNTWHGMLMRCYCKTFNSTRETYQDCTVCDEWHNLFIFDGWYTKNYYAIPGERMELDKDIIHKGNKVYSPENCVFVPQRINKLIVNAKRIRGEFPIGVYFDKQKQRFIANMNYEGKNLKIKHCRLPIEVFCWYKLYKEDYIKQVADEYRDLIPKCLYEALYNWTVEITD